MADLSRIEKAQLERCFGMSDGYVLSFSNKTFAESILLATGIDIDQEKYFAGGTSKANRLRTFLQLEDGRKVATLIRALIEQDAADDITQCRQPGREDEELRAACLQVAVRLEKMHAPLESEVFSSLSRFDFDWIGDAWAKAISRKENDPAGAITAARSMLETTCKLLLEVQGITYSEKADLPALYGATAKSLNLAPSQHTEDAFRRILGSCHAIVETVGTLRNRIGDAHGQGGKPVKPAPRHAALVVNLAGTMAGFLVETWRARQDSLSTPPESWEN